MNAYNIVASTDESTVVAEYSPPYRTAADYQSEAALEQEFIGLLSARGYEYLAITNEAVLIDNLRRQLEIHNAITFSNDEWTRFLMTVSQVPMRALLRKPERYRTTMFEY